MNRDLEGGGDQRIGVRAGAGPLGEHGPAVQALVPPADGIRAEPAAGQGGGDPGRGSLADPHDEAVVVRRVPIIEREFAQHAVGWQLAEDGAGVGGAGGDLRVQPGQAAQPDRGERRGELVVDAVLPTGEVAQPGVVLGLFGEGVVVGEDEPAFPGGEQFAVVGGKASGGSEGSRVPAADERAVGLGGVFDDGYPGRGEDLGAGTSSALPIHQADAAALRPGGQIPQQIQAAAWAGPGQAGFLAALARLERWLAWQQIPYAVFGSVAACAWIDQGSSLDFDRPGARDPAERLPDIDVLVPRASIAAVKSHAAAVRRDTAPVRIDTFWAECWIDFRPEAECSYLTHRAVRLAVPTGLFTPRTASLLGQASQGRSPTTCSSAPARYFAWSAAARIGAGHRRRVSAGPGTAWRTARGDPRRTPARRGAAPYRRTASSWLRL